LEKEKLDDAAFRCQYNFEQLVTENENDHILSNLLILDIGSKHSIYYDWDKMRQDSVHKAKIKKIQPTITTINVRTEENISPAGTKGQLVEYDKMGDSRKIYKNRPKNEVTSIDGSDLEVFKCVEKLRQEWMTQDEFTTILGYLCQKATTTFRGRNYIAWFAAELPIDDGPWKFYGLPGLILKVEDEQGIFRFTAIGIENVEKGTIEIAMYKDEYIHCNYNQINDYQERKQKREVDIFVNHGAVTITNNSNPITFQRMEVK
jgi:GLPGLI family protein